MCLDGNYNQEIYVFNADINYMYSAEDIHITHTRRKVSVHRSADVLWAPDGLFGSEPGTLCVLETRRALERQSARDLVLKPNSRVKMLPKLTELPKQFMWCELMQFVV